MSNTSSPRLDQFSRAAGQAQDFIKSLIGDRDPFAWVHFLTILMIHCENDEIVNFLSFNNFQTESPRKRCHGPRFH